MSTGPHHPTNRESIINCNAAVARRFGVTLRVYKTIKAMTQLASVATGFYAIAQGADPTTTFALVAAVLVGPEAAETIIASSDTGSD